MADSSSGLPVPPAKAAPLKEWIAKWKTDTAIGDTNMGFGEWLKVTAPHVYSTWLKDTGQGK